MARLAKPAASAPSPKAAASPPLTRELVPTEVDPTASAWAFIPTAVAAPDSAWLLAPMALAPSASAVA